MGQTKHDRIADRLAQQEGTEHNKGPGPDIVTPKRVIEVATDAADLKDSTRQLQGFDKPRYIAVPKELVPKAVEDLKGTGIGVKGPTGHTHKRPGRSKR